MPKLSTKDFDYYKKTVEDDITEHNLRLQRVNTPNAVIAMYEGLLSDESATEDSTAEDVIENYLLIAVNTIIPTLFYQVPRPIIRPKEREDLNYSAAVIDALVKAYFDDNLKSQNQLCIIDAFLPYGYAVMKNGYNSRTGKVAQPNLLTGESTSSVDPKNLEANCEYLKFERPLLTRHSPKYTYLDKTKPFGKGKHITFEHERTLSELKASSLYQLSDNFVKYFSTRAKDEREVKFRLFEHFRFKENRVWKLVYVSEWDEELLWKETPYKELPVSLLRFNKTPDQLYNVAHGSLGYKAQKELNYLNLIWKKHVDSIRRQHLVWMAGLNEAGKKAIKFNDIDGIVECDKPVTAGVYQQVVSTPMGKDVYANIENVRNYLKLLFSVSGGRMGESDVEFAETEKNQQVGDFMRMSGLQDSIRDFVRDQIKKMVINIVNLGNPEITLRITGKDVKDPVTGEVITGKELQFGGEGGLVLRNEIMGDLENDYLYDIDITSASRPDFAVIRKQLADGITMAVGLRPLLQEKGKDLDIVEMTKDYFNTYDTIPNPDKYIVDMTPEEMEMARIQQQLAVMGGAGQKPSQKKVPTEQNIQKGASSVPTGAEGLVQ